MLRFSCSGFQGKVTSLLFKLIFEYKLNVELSINTIKSLWAKKLIWRNFKTKLSFTPFLHGALQLHIRMQTEDSVYSEKGTDFPRTKLEENLSFDEQIMSNDKYSCICLKANKGICPPNIFAERRAPFKILHKQTFL